METKATNQTIRAAVKLVVFFKHGPGINGIPFWGNRSRKGNFNNADAFEKDCKRLRYLLSGKWQNTYQTAILYDCRSGQEIAIEKWIDGAKVPVNV